MENLKPMSATDYRANADKVNSQKPTEIVQLKSGSVFELRRPDLQSYMMMGRLPKTLVDVGVKAWKQGAAQAANELSDEEAEDALVFMREIVHECTVKPKFVQFATNDDQISASDMLKEDFDEIFAWAMGHKGVAGVDGLRSFRSGSTRRTSGARSNGKKQRRKGKQSAETVASVR